MEIFFRIEVELHIFILRVEGNVAMKFVSYYKYKDVWISQLFLFSYFLGSNSITSREAFQPHPLALPTNQSCDNP